jgi:polyketide cyclase/dehydrase/lipid transport protein
VSEYHEQGLVDAPTAVVWELVGNPGSYPRWWPSWIEVDGEDFDMGSEFVQLSHGPMRQTHRTVFHVDQLEELREIRMHCTKSGMYAHWRLTPAQDATFVDVAGGMEPLGFAAWAYDATLGRRFWRSWAAGALSALRESLMASSPPR